MTIHQKHSIEDWDALVVSFSCLHADADPDANGTRKTCCHCKCTKFISENLMTLCAVCGTIQDTHRLDDTAEWRFFGEGKDPNRCGNPTNDLMPESSLSTFIGAGCGSKYAMISRISKFQIWNSVPYKERAFHSASEYITNVAVNHGIPDSIIGDAKVLLKKVTDLGVTRGENRKGLLACSVYVACIMNNVPRSIKEIAAHFNVTQMSMSKVVKKFSGITGGIHSTRASDYVMRYCCDLNVDKILTDKCMRLTQSIEDVIVGTTPVSCVAGCIHYVAKKAGIDTVVPRSKIALVCGVSEATVLKCYKKLLELENSSHGVELIV